MKKEIIGISIIVLMLTILTLGCIENDTGASLAPEEMKFVGTWTSDKSTFTCNADRTCTGTLGNFKVESGKLVFYSAFSEKIYGYAFLDNGNVLKLINIDDGGTATYTKV